MTKDRKEESEIRHKTHRATLRATLTPLAAAPTPAPSAYPPAMVPFGRLGGGDSKGGLRSRYARHSRASLPARYRQPSA